MSTNKTEHLNLHQWEAADPFLREEFNENFVAIDGAVAEIGSMTAGSYTGDGAAQRLIELGFQPKAVLVQRSNGAQVGQFNETFGGLALAGMPMGSSGMALTVTETGFQVSYRDDGRCFTNVNGTRYYYLALK